jgi:hypothetical protein
MNSSKSKNSCTQVYRRGLEQTNRLNEIALPDAFAPISTFSPLSSTSVFRNDSRFSNLTCRSNMRTVILARDPAPVTNC